METDSSFVRTYSIVVLDAVAHVGMHISLIICPGHPKRENPIGNTEPLDQIAFFKLDIPIIGIFDGIQYLFYCLVVFRFVGNRLFNSVKTSFAFIRYRLNQKPARRRVSWVSCI